MRKIIAALSYFRPPPAAVAMALVCLGLLYFIFVGLTGPDDDTATSKPPQGVAQEVQPADGTPLEVQEAEKALEEQKVDLRTTVKACEEALNSYSWSDTPEVRIERIRWCSMPEFLDAIKPTFALTDTQADRMFVEQKRRVEATVDPTRIIGEFDEQERDDGQSAIMTACQSVEVVARVIDPDGSRSDPSPLRVQRNWVLTPEGWKIHSDIRYYESC